MTTARTIDVVDFFETRPLSRYNYLIIASTFLIMFFDGLDMVALAFVAPYAKEAMSLSNAQLGAAFSSGMAGMVVGGLLFGWLADRYGRRPLLLFCALAFSVLTAATSLAENHIQLIALRFVSGLVIGGLPPLCTALNIECVSSRIRATVVTTTFVGYSLGVAAAGPLTNWIAPEMGWRMVFIVAGGLSFLVSLSLFFTMPESVRFLMLSGQRGDVAKRILARFEPALRAVPADQLVLTSRDLALPQSARTTQIRTLFQGRLRWITPLLWLAYGASWSTVTFLSSWNPILFEGVGLAREQAANAGAIANVLGAVIGLILMRFTDKVGPVAILCLPLGAAVLLVTSGMFGFSPATFLALNIAAQAIAGGGHFGVLSISPTFYGVSTRASGVAAAISVGKLISIFSPMIGAAMLAAGLHATVIYATIAIFPALFALSLLGILLTMKAGRRRGDPAPVVQS